MPKDKNHDWTRTAIRFAFIALALGCVSLAQAANDAKYTKFTNTSGVQLLIPTPSPGTPPPAGLGQLLWDRAVTVPTANTLPQVAGTGSMINPSGRPVPVSGKSNIPSAEIAKAVGRAAGKIIGVTAIPLALLQLCQEVSSYCSKAEDGSLKVEKADPTICTVSPCYTYQFRTAAPSGSFQQACTNGIGLGESSGYGYATYTSVVESQHGACRYVASYSGGSFITDLLAMTVTAATPAPHNRVPSALQELQDAIASKSGWPTSTSASEFMRQDIEAGGKPSVTTIQVSGPATSAGPSSTTTNTTNNTTTTNTTTHHHSYAGNTVNTTTSVTSITINNTTGDTINSTTTTSENEPPPEQEKCAEGDPTLACAEADTPTGEIPRETKTITYTEENVFGSGACPANLTANIGTLGSNVTVWDWQKTCAAALPLRALVLALASFAALLIVMPGRVET